MGVLARHYMQQRSVGFYAGQLNLTPKYLTTIIRKTSGRTAVQWIDDYVVLEAKNLLKYSTMSIQEISYYLNFPNQSFFGKYFKNHTGMTPPLTGWGNSPPPRSGMKITRASAPGNFWVHPPAGRYISGPVQQVVGGYIYAGRVCRYGLFREGPEV